MVRIVPPRTPRLRPVGRRVGPARLGVAIALSAAATLGLASAVAANEPSGRASPPLAADDLRLDGHESYAERVTTVTPAPTPAPPSSAPAPTPAATATPEPEPEPSIVGIDISYPQCDRELPTDIGFAIVGVNGGRVHSANPCLGPSDDGTETGQLAWAGRDVELYLNTGNPGPLLSRHWPLGESEPRPCLETDPDSLDCAYAYGWNAAVAAHDVALEAYRDLTWVEADADRLPEGVTWWLDVEDANSWRRDHERNVAALEGMVDALRSLGATEIGFYSTPRLWDRITGGTDAFAAYPAWHAGALDEDDARDRCDEAEAFTGGTVHMVQWVEDGLDRNLRCEDASDS